MTTYHFAGIAGQGMNPLARLMAARGHRVQGSDRAFDQGQAAAARDQLAACGIAIVPQDGSGIDAGIERYVHSTAVETDTPEYRAAVEAGCERVPRPTLLAEIVNDAEPGIAVAGTSGKSTVVGMLTWILRQAGRPATVLGGAALVGEGQAGCFAVGPAGGLVVAEACESDGTLIGYRPDIGLLHSVSRDHGEVDEVMRQFATFAAQTRRCLVNAASEQAQTLPHARSYGPIDDADCPLQIIATGPWSAIGELTLAPQRVVEIQIRQPGAHNLVNAAAAALLAHEVGIDDGMIAAALASFPGVARRFEVVGRCEGNITVVDDYAHNGEKIAAALRAAQAGSERVVAVFQPHGFGPARFLRPELRELLPQILRPSDRWCYTDIYYAGGSVAQDISSADLAADLPGQAAYAPDRGAVLQWIAEQATPGSTVLILGARDPSLGDLARAVVELL